jgi:hypothetical protein
MQNIPEKRFSAGAVTATVWKNEAPANTAGTFNYFTVSLQRNYKDKQGAWQSANSMRLNDLPKAALVLGKAYEYLVYRQPGDRNINIEENS